VSSVAGFRGDPGGGIYSTSKFAIEGLSESLAGELAPLGIKVTIVEPGYFRADFLTSGSMQVAVNVLHDYDATAGQVRRLMKEYDGRQANDPRKLARAIVTLANSDEPPLRFTAGADAVTWFEEQLAKKRAELDRWRTLSSSLAFEQ
jgi:NAD(P)-dependent dehydrogenase (short-subunit alcohol dehydrogenase family)